MFTKDMKAGYQGKPDSMREKAGKLMGPQEAVKAVYFSKSSEQLPYMRPYKEGGHVKPMSDEMERKSQAEHHEKMEKMKKGGSCKAKGYAAGGVAKIRHGQATKDGEQAPQKKSPIKKGM